MTIRYLLAATAIAAAPLAAQSPLRLTTDIKVAQRSNAADGTTRIALVSPGRVVPGDTVTVVLGWHNTGRAPLSNVVLANPVPRGLAYRAAAPGSPAPEVSVDGKTFGALAALRVRTPRGQTRAAAPSDVTAVRWRLASPVTAGAQGQYAFQAVVE